MASRASQPHARSANSKFEFCLEVVRRSHAIKLRSPSSTISIFYSSDTHSAFWNDGLSKKGLGCFFWQISSSSATSMIRLDFVYNSLSDVAAFEMQIVKVVPNADLRTFGFGLCLPLVCQSQWLRYRMMLHRPWPGTLATTALVGGQINGSSDKFFCASFFRGNPCRLSATVFLPLVIRLCLGYRPKSCLALVGELRLPLVTRLPWGVGKPVFCSLQFTCTHMIGGSLHPSRVSTWRRSSTHPRQNGQRALGIVDTKDEVVYWPSSG